LHLLRFFASASIFLYLRWYLFNVRYNFASTMIYLLTRSNWCIYDDVFYILLQFFAPALIYSNVRQFFASTTIYFFYSIELYLWQFFTSAIDFLQSALIYSNFTVTFLASNDFIYFYVNWFASMTIFLHLRRFFTSALIYSNLGQFIFFNQRFI